MRRLLGGALLLAVLGGGGYALIATGTYGLTIFVLIPVALGAVTVLISQPETSAKAVLHGASAVGLGLVAFLAAGLEGLICIAMSAPLAIPLGALGGWLMFQSQSSRAVASSAAMLLLLPPATLSWDINAKPT